jgi:hypothetical protein
LTWRTGTKNPHTLYLDEGDVSLPQGFIMNPGAARAIVEAMNGSEGETPRDVADAYGAGPDVPARTILRARKWYVPVERTVTRLPVTVVLVSGAIGDYAVYLGIGEPGFVEEFGDKLAFDEARGFFPHLDAVRYRP